MAFWLVIAGAAIALATGRGSATVLYTFYPR
jgi:hypothetical protein